MEQRWYTLDEAPKNEPGHLWCEKCGDRTDATGMVWDREDRIWASGQWQGYDWTHWHPFPEPPGGKVEG